MNSFTSADATALTKSDESYTPKGVIIDAIKASARKGKGSLSLTEFRISEDTRQEFEEDGFLVGVGAISWETYDSAPVS
tara:strand:+ start:5120 stop:5356 length:237 start_codon:yes stop_codon:yes gene_type:complete